MRIRSLLAAVLASLPVASMATGYTSTATASGSLVVKTAPAVLAGLNVTSGASAGYVMVFDAKTVPADGTVTPAYCVPLAANTGLDINFRSDPINYNSGIVVVFSTTGCFSKTISATAFISVNAR